MIKNAIISVIPIFIILMILSFLYKASKEKPKEDGMGNKILKLPNFYYILGAVLIIGGLVILVYGFFVKNQIDKIYVIIFSLFLFLPGILLFLKGYVSHIIITDFSLLEVSSLGKKTEIKWDEIKTITFGKSSKELSIKSNDKIIKAYCHLIGFNYLVDMLELKTNLVDRDSISF